MRRFLLSLVLFLATAAHADLIARSGNDSVRLTDQPCANQAILERLNQEHREDYHAGSAVVDGVPFEHCWRPLGTAVHLMYQDGDQGLIDLGGFKPERDI